MGQLLSQTEGKEAGRRRVETRGGRQGQREISGAGQREKSRQKRDRGTNGGAEQREGGRGCSSVCARRKAKEAARGPARTRARTRSHMAVAASKRESPGRWGLGEEQTGTAFLEVRSQPLGNKVAPRKEPEQLRSSPKGPCWQPRTLGTRGQQSQDRPSELIGRKGEKQP